MTLPLIYALQHASWLEKKRIVYIIKNQSEKARKVHEVINFVKASGGIEYATEAMHAYHREAQEILSAFPDSDYKQSLTRLVEYTIERKK